MFNFPLGGGGDLLFFSRQIGIDPVTGEQVPINVGGRLLDHFGTSNSASWMWRHAEFRAESLCKLML